MHSRKKHDKNSKTAKESPSKSSSKPQPSKASPRRRPQTRTDDLRTSPYTYCRQQSPSPSRGSSRTSLSPVSVTDGFVRTISDDGATSSVSSSPGNSGLSYGRCQWFPAKKLSSRSRHSETQSGKPKVMVSEVANGRVLVKRTQDEKSYDPDRLAMDKCGLTACPIVEGEEQLRLLNLRNNEIKRIENMFSFSFLMFLDLSENHVEQITSLESLVSLRVLMLAKNRIKCIEGLECLIHLDVLDLSGNEIEEISNIGHLHELRVLNLSSNMLRQLNCLKGLDSLVELNLNKNFISILVDLDDLPRLQRLFVAQNSIERFEDMACIVNAPSLSELSLEGCPVTQRPHYRYFILFRMWQLKFLDMRRILDEEKRTAQIVMRKEEMKRQEIIRMAKIKEAREKAIDNARILWEKNDEASMKFTDVQGQDKDNIFPSTSAVPLQLLATRSLSFSEEEEDCSICEGSGLPCEYCNGSRQKNIFSKFGVKSSRSKQKYSKRSHDSLKTKKSRISSPLELELADSNLTYLAEVEEHTLQLYGPGAVAAAISHPWHPNTVGFIHNICFHFVAFDSIAHLLNKVKAQFLNVTAVTFECTNLQTLPQLNALGQISGLLSVTVESEGNPLVELSLWRPYIIYRLGPSVAFINGSPVTELERIKAEEMFGGICTALFSLLPKYRLSSLLNNPRVKQIFLSEKGYSPNSLQGQPDNQISSEVVKAALTYSPDSELKSVGHHFVGKKILERTVTSVDETVRKRVVFQQHWSSIFFGVINDALEDFTDINRHMKLSMQVLLKKYKLLNDNIYYY